MTITFEKFKLIAKTMRSRFLFMDEYIDKIPSDISAAFFDNTYTDELGLLNDFLVAQLFEDTDLREELYYFVHEWKEGKDNKVRLFDVESNLRTEDEYFEFVKKLHFKDE